MNPFIEKLPDRLDASMHRLNSAEEQVLIQVATDMSGPDAFDERWLVITPSQLVCLHEDGVVEVEECPLESIANARIEPLVGGGRMEIERKQGTPLQMFYSNSLAPKFGEVAEGINQLTKGKEVRLPTKLERSRCERCHRILPEKDGICPACLAKWQTLKRLLSYLLPYRLKAILAMLVIAFSTGLQLTPALVVEYIIDDVLPTGLSSNLIWPLVILLAVNVAGWVAAVLRRWLASVVALRSMEDLRADLFRALQFLPLRFYDKRKIGAMVSRMNNDSDLVEEYMTFDIPFVLSNSLLVIGIITVMFFKSWLLTLYVLLPIPFIVVGGRSIWGRLENCWRRWSVKWSRFSTHLNESITGIRIVKAFSQEDRESERFAERNGDVRRVTVTAERNWLVFFMVTNFLITSGGFLVWYFGARLVLLESFSKGTLILFVSLLWMLYEPLRWFGDFYAFMVRAYAGAERIFEVIDSRREAFDDAGAVAMPSIRGHVRCREMDFGYDPGKPILKQIDLDVAPGEMIGLVGRSGAGKSTLINLICRFYDPTRGSLEIDGEDVRNIRLEDLRNQIGLVAQQSFLFSGSVADNLRYGNPNASFAEVVAAARAANAHEFIITLPDGYDSRIGEEGGSLSGGEKQRMAIARALLRDPRILILDEATSSLDTPTEKKIQEAVARLVSGRTTFAIAHRLSTLRSADRLLVLDEGRIVETGTHEELMDRQGLFFRMVMTQRESSAVMAPAAGVSASH